MDDTGSWFWTVAIIVGPVVLAIAFVYVLLMNRRRRRDPSLERRREEVTREHYHEE